MNDMEENLEEQNDNLLSKNGSHYYTPTAHINIDNTQEIIEPIESEKSAQINFENEQANFSEEIHKANTLALAGILLCYVSLYFWFFNSFNPYSEAFGIFGNILLWKHYRTYKESTIKKLQQHAKYTLTLAIIHIVSIILILLLKIALLSLSIGIQLLLAILREVYKEHGS